ncbi:unnamed protein product [Paramecium sonneborni]|uniref:Uncharacterized protein n=1 Tax=Paramecium sonneborni TaxID=65129 RepID=A0A8S1QPV5_9CILI|nr:unnamed protein product [Paramecium sonneborni]
MSKIPILHMKQILDSKIDYTSSITQIAMKKLGLTQSALQRINYKEYMASTNNSQQDYFLYLHAITMNINKLQKEIQKMNMNMKDKSINCTNPENVEEIIALLDKRMKNKIHTSSQACLNSNRDKSIELDDTLGCKMQIKQKNIKLALQGLKSITERNSIQKTQIANQNSICNSSNSKKIILKKLVVSNNQSVAELFQKQQASIDVSTMEQLNESIRKYLPDKNVVIMSGIRYRLKDNVSEKKSIDEQMQKITKIRSISQQSIDTGRQIPKSLIKQGQQKYVNVISTKLEMMLRQEKLIREEPLKIQKVKLGSLMGVIQKIRNQQTKLRMFEQINNDYW